MSEREQFVRIFTFTDKICKIVRPTTCVYLAVDGVAPRAKMNQQRSRRFRSAMEREELMKELVAAGDDVPSSAEAFDSNCITPGTEFMYKLGVAFRAWLSHKCATDPFYGGENAPLVIFSEDGFRPWLWGRCARCRWRRAWSTRKALRTCTCRGRRGFQGMRRKGGAWSCVWR